MNEEVKKARCPNCGASKWGVTVENEIQCVACKKPTFRYRYYEQLEEKNTQAFMKYEDAILLNDLHYQNGNLSNTRTSWEAFDLAVGYALSRRIRA